MKHLIAVHHEFSKQSTLLIVIFAVVFAAAVLCDLAGLLQYSGLIRGLPDTMLEIGGSVTAIAIFPLIVMGMSIAHDLNRKAA